MSKDKHEAYIANNVTIFGENTGIGAIAVHPNQNYFAIGEAGKSPAICLYKHDIARDSETKCPEYHKVCSLSSGTQSKFNDLEFNMDGVYLASISGSPDHTLTIWDWKAQTVILRCKAFSQDVFTVRFSRYNNNKLFTAGTGHIRFWEMAQTFTGLKLQGQIGKFGDRDLSDISSFVEYHNGKILSSSESGMLLMWQDCLIQFVLRPDPDITPQISQCHDGPVVYVHKFKASMQNWPKLAHVKSNPDSFDCIITAGADGYIRLWDNSGVEFFEPTETKPDFLLELIHEVRLPSAKSRPVSVTFSADESHWIIQDNSGFLWKLSKSDLVVETLMRFHGYRVSGIQANTHSHNVITCGIDGTVRNWDMMSQEATFLKQFNDSIQGLLCLSNLPYHCKCKLCC